MTEKGVRREEKGDFDVRKAEKRPVDRGLCGRSAKTFETFRIERLPQLSRMAFNRGRSLNRNQTFRTSHTERPRRSDLPQLTYRETEKKVLIGTKKEVLFPGIRKRERTGTRKAVLFPGEDGVRLDGSGKWNSEPEREVRGQMGVEREFLIPRKQKGGRTKAA